MPHNEPNPVELPPGIAIAWGLERPSTRGTKAELSATRIVEAAIRLADEEGLTAVSMARVAKDLGFTSMSLYRHLRSKEELLVLMVDAAFGEPDIADIPGSTGPGSEPDWRTATRNWAKAIEQRYRRHPWILDYPVTGPPASPHELLWLEQLLRALAPTSLTASEKLNSALMLANLVRSSTRMELDVADNDSPAAFEAYVGMLFKLLDAEKHREVLGLFSDPELAVMEQAGDELSFALERYLDGMEALMLRRSSGAVQEGAGKE
ncbi:TetR/AcrR family transcriptional regulator [Paenarthrobacter nitroguajacolicus]|uniref:TetR/AcrR family transcriptional regulator n=1 Tax=Paenarthrobacter nitroguajacolicus TaxID=211146 RepID=UPI000B303124|nr:TetR/AcrR family transcriptional regulator [Paenarthrobacter nitroguajacolicus]